MDIPPEATALQAALHALNQPPDSTHLPALSRAVTRAADDLELAAEETADRAVRTSLLVEISCARTAVAAARKRAREAALTLDRSQLFESAQQAPVKEAETDAARLAREINDSLRRTTAIVSEEIGRSRAAGDIVEQSTRRLRMTRDQHGSFRQSLSSGAVTLKSIRSTEMLANVLIIASFAIFFLAAAYVTKRRIANSNISTFVFRPGMKVASIPLRVAAWMFRSIGGVAEKAEPSELGGRKISSTAQQGDEAVRAKEGRERVETAGVGESRRNREEIEVSHAGVESPEENDTCQAENKCMSTEASGAKRPSGDSAEATLTSDDHSRGGNETPKSQESELIPEDPSEATVSDAEIDKSQSVRSDEIIAGTSGSKDASSDEDPNADQPTDENARQNQEQSEGGTFDGANDELQERSRAEAEENGSGQGNERGGEPEP